MATQHALIIGVDASRVDHHLQPLDYACRDARATHLVFAEMLGYGPNAVLLEGPNLSDARRALRKIGQAVRAGDTFVFYYAGHGARDGDDQLLLLGEVDLLELDKGHAKGNDVLSLEGLMATVADWPDVHAAFVLDACRKPLRKGERTAGYSADVQQVLQGVVARNAGLRLSRQATTNPQPYCVFNACGDGQRAYELEGLQRGLFSHVFCDWLKDGARLGQARVLGPQVAPELAARMRDIANDQRASAQQQPWLAEPSPEVVLWRPRTAAMHSVASEASNPATDYTPDNGISGPSATATPTHANLPQLLAAFEQQLLSGRLHHPLMDCCVATLALLRREGLGEEVLQIYIGRVESALVATHAQPAPPKQPRPLGVFRDAAWAPEMVAIPSGEFMMGSPTDELERLPWEGPQHKVIISQSFGLGRCAVTFAEFDLYAKACVLPPPNDQGWGREGMPVICVSWQDAQGYIAWLNEQLGLNESTGHYRLPTEAEWEYAARAGSKGPYWWGDAVNPGMANYNGGEVYAGGGSKGEYRKSTLKANAFESNPWGLYNVHGNVWEWVQDGWHRDYKGAPNDGREWKEGADLTQRVVRGGSWVNEPRNLRSADRYMYSPGYSGKNVGFRLVRTF